MTRDEVWMRTFLTKGVSLNGADFSTFAAVDLNEGTGQLSIRTDVTLRLAKEGHVAQISAVASPDQMRQMAKYLLEMANHLEGPALDLLLTIEREVAAARDEVTV